MRWVADPAWQAIRALGPVLPLTCYFCSRPRALPAGPPSRRRAERLP
ncbi:hypothetical protein [Plantactinospora sp. WMMB782]